jgi:hypothetical protein
VPRLHQQNEKRTKIGSSRAFSDVGDDATPRGASLTGDVNYLLEKAQEFVEIPDRKM